MDNPGAYPEPFDAIEPHWTVAAHYLNALLVTAESLGASRKMLCLRADIPVDCGSDPDQRFHMSKLLFLLKLIAKTCNTADIGLIAGGRMQPQTLGILGLLGQCAKSVGHCFELWLPYRYALLHSGNTDIAYSDDVVRLTWYPLSKKYIEDRYLVDVFFSTWIAMTKTMFGVEFKPIEVFLTYPKPANTEMIRHYYGANVTYNYDQNAVVISRSIMEQSNPQHIPDIMRILEAHARESHERHATAFCTSQQVKLALLKLLPIKKATIIQVAEALQLSERTLQRRLKEEGAVFNTLLRELRQALAEEKLHDGCYSITEIALSLGYNDSSSFSKAFRQWTGQNPSAFRQQNPS